MQEDFRRANAEEDEALRQGDDGPLNSDEQRKIDAYWRATLYLCVGMIYLRDNPLLRKPLEMEHIKNRLLGHWGSDPGQTFTWVRLNRLIKKHDLNMVFVSGPGHGAPRSGRPQGRRLLEGAPVPS